MVTMKMMTIFLLFAIYNSFQTVNTWEKDCQDAIYCSLVNGDVTNNKKYYDDAVALASQCFDFELFGDKMTKYLSPEALYSSEPGISYKKIKDELSTVGIYFSPTNQSVLFDMLDKSKPFVEVIKDEICERSLATCQKRIKKFAKKTCNWRAIPATLFNCTKIKEWPKKATKVLDSGHLNCNEIRSVCGKPEWRQMEPGEYQDYPCTLTRGIYEKPPAFHHDEFYNTPCYEIITLNHDPEWENPATLRSVDRLSQGQVFGEKNQCHGEYVASFNADRKANGYSHIAMNCHKNYYAISRLGGRYSCRFTSPMVSIRVRKPARTSDSVGPYYIEDLQPMCGGWVPGYQTYVAGGREVKSGLAHLIVLGDIAEEHNLTCGPEQAICGWRTYDRLSDGNSHLISGFMSVAQTAASKLAKTACETAGKVPDEGVPGAMATRTAAMKLACHAITISAGAWLLAKGTVIGALATLGDFVHDVQIKCCDLHHDCMDNARDEWMIIPDGNMTLDNSDQDCKVKSHCVHNVAYRSGTEDINVIDGSGPIYKIAHKSLERVFNDSRLSKKRFHTGISWEHEALGKYEFLNETIPSVKFPAGLLTRGYQAVAICGIARYLSKTIRQVEFINVTACHLTTKWSPFESYSYPFQTLGKINLTIGTNFTTPKSDKMGGQPFVTHDEVVEGLGAKINHTIKSYFLNNASISELLDELNTTEREVDFGKGAIPLRGILLQRIEVCTAPHNTKHKFMTMTDEIYAINIPDVRCKPTHYLERLPFDGQLNNIKEERDGKKVIRYYQGIYWPEIEEAKLNGVNFDATINIANLTGDLVQKLVDLEGIPGVPFRWDDVTENVNYVSTKENEGTRLHRYVAKTIVNIYQVVGRCGPYKVYTDGILIEVGDSTKTECKYNGVFIPCPPAKELPKAENCLYTEYFRKFKSGTQHIFKRDQNHKTQNVQFPIGVSWENSNIYAYDTYENQNVSQILYKRITRLGISRTTGFNLSTLSIDDFERDSFAYGFEKNFELGSAVDTEFFQNIVSCGEYILSTRNIWKRVTGGGNCNGSTGPFVKCNFVPILEGSV